jgi:phosphogluconate dehydratase
MFDAAVYLGVCDKIVPGLTIAALTFGHLPAVFIPGRADDIRPAERREGSKVRQLFAEGKAGRAELLEAESKSYHGPGTCTFYGTANSNQMLMEIMGLHTPGASFINPGTPLRDALTREATKRALAITALGNEFTPAGEMIDERSIVNGVVGLHATGGSTNHTIHLIAMARAAGIVLTWQDISDLSDSCAAAGARLSERACRREPFPCGRRHGLPDPRTADARPAARGRAHGLGRRACKAYAIDPKLATDGAVVREPSPKVSGDPKVLANIENPFQPTGGLKVLTGNLGNAIIKISAVKPERRVIEAPAKVFHRPGGAERRLQGRRTRPRFRRCRSASRARRPTACRNCTG